MYSLPTGPYIFPIRPFRRATDWNFSAWTRLWPLYTILCYWSGRDIGLTVPSIKQQFSRGAPFACMASAYSCNKGGLKISWFHWEILWLWLLKILFTISFVIMDNSRTGLPNLNIGMGKKTFSVTCINLQFFYIWFFVDNRCLLVVEGHLSEQGCLVFAHWTLLIIRLRRCFEDQILHTNCTEILGSWSGSSPAIPSILRLKLFYCHTLVATSLLVHEETFFHRSFVELWRQVSKLPPQKLIFS